MAGLFSAPGNEPTKKQISPKRRRQRSGGILIVIWALISLVEGIGSAIDDTRRSLIFISITVAFCLAGGLFIYMSSKPDIEWDKEQKQQEMDFEDPALFFLSNDETTDEDSPNSKYLE